MLNRLPNKLLYLLWVLALSPLALSNRHTGQSIGSIGPSQALFFFSMMISAYIITLVISFKEYKRSEYQSSKASEFLFIAILGVLIAASGTGSWLDDDIYRYMWDGYSLSTGHSPVSYLPSGPSSGFPESIRSLIGYRNTATVYPPLALYFYKILWIIGGANIHFWHYSFAFVTIVLLVLFKLLMRQFKSPLWLQALILLNPFLIKEFADSAHIDVLALAFLCFALLNKKRHLIRNGLLLTCGTLVKIYPILFVPFWPRYTKTQKLTLASFSLLLSTATIYFFYGEEMPQAIKAFQYFRDNWLFHHGFTDIIYWLVSLFSEGASDLWNQAIKISNTIAIVIYLLFAGLAFFKPKPRYVLYGIGLFIITQSAINSWYTLWIFPALIQSSSSKTTPWPVLAWGLLPLFSLLGYSYWISFTDYPNIRRLNWVLFLFFLIYSQKQQKVIDNQPSTAKNIGNN